MASRFTVVVVGVPPNDEQTGVSSIPPPAKRMIVYARKQQKDTLAIGDQLRSSPGNSAVPILLVIGRYEISRGNAVERMGNAMRIITPFDQDKLREKTRELLKSCSLEYSRKPGDGCPSRLGGDQTQRRGLSPDNAFTERTGIEPN